MKPLVQRLPELDLLRFVAAMAVVLFHFCAAPIIGGQADRNAFGAVSSIARYGYLGVELFFLISGFVIIMSAQTRTARGFLAHRAVRLYPSFWVAVLLTCVALWILGPRPDDVPSFRVIAANLTMLPGYLGAPKIDEVYWTLAVELKFYALVAVCIACGLARRGEQLAVLWLLLLALADLGIGGAPLRSVTIFPHGALFAAGVLLYFVHRDGWTTARVVALTAAWFLAARGALRSLPDFIPVPSAMDPVVVVSALSACFLLVAWAARRPGTLRWPALWTLLGAFTYPLYLIHGRLGRLVFASLEPIVSPPVALLIECAVVFLLAWVVVHLVEQRMVRTLARSALIRWLSGDRPPRSVAQVAARGLRPGAATDSLNQ